MYKDSFIIPLKWQSGRCLINLGLTQLHESFTRRADTDVNQVMDGDGDTDQIHGVWTHNCPVQVMVCLLSCAEEVFKYEAFGVLMFIFNRKIRRFVFYLITK